MLTEAEIQAKNFWRYKLLIYPKFQITLIVVNLLVTLAILAFITWQINGVLINLMDIRQTANFPKDHIYYQFINWQLTEIYSFMATAFFFAIVLSSLTTLYISHKLVGPLGRLRDYFKGIEKTGQIEHE